MKKKFLKFINKIKKIDKKNIIIFLIPFVLFLIALLVFFPGSLTYDSYNQIEQIKTGIFSDGHPFFHTFIEMVLMNIWDSPASIGLFQILFFSSLWTRICKYNRNKCDTKLVFSFQIIISLFIGLSPLNSLMSVTLWKDILYSYCILWLAFRLQIFIDKNFKVNFKHIILLSFILVLLCNLRHNGLVITAGVGLILFIILIIKDKKSWNFAKLLVFIVIFYASFSCLKSLYVPKNIVASNKSSINIMDDELLTMVGYIARSGNVSSEEEKKLNLYVDFEEVKERSRYNLHDIVSGACDPKYDYINNNRKEFYSLIYDLSIKNKTIVIDYLLKENSFIINPVRLDDSYGYIINYGAYSRNAGEYLYTQPLKDTIIYNVYVEFIKMSINNKIFETIYYSGSLYLYVSIICLFILRKFNKRYLLILSPVLFNLAGLILTMPVNDVRYYYSSILVGYFFMLITGCKYFSEEKQIEEKTEDNIHTFVVLAYKESSYLEKCIISVLNQTKKSNILIATSTPNKYISEIAKKYNLEIIENKDETGIGNDFNFAVRCAKTKLVTIAHQDDIYDKDYYENIYNEYIRNKDSIILFTDYYEIKKNKKVYKNKLLTIKRILLFPLSVKSLSGLKFNKRICLSFGSPICCPAVTFNKSLIKKDIFPSKYKLNVDWYAWESISKIKGKFIFIRKKLMGHRIHSESTTTLIIKDDGRTKEDEEMFRKFWPKSIAKFINKFYKSAQKSNDL